MSDSSLGPQSAQSADRATTKPSTPESSASEPSATDSVATDASATRVTPIAVDPSEIRDPAVTSLVEQIAQAAADRKGDNLVVLQVSEVSYLADYFVLVTGFSRTQVRAISQSIVDVVAKQSDRDPLRMEGQSESSWILIDYGEVIVHIMLPDEREFYNLEAFWNHGERWRFEGDRLLPPLPSSVSAPPGLPTFAEEEL
jgi:ribosome-associated protein